MKAVVAAFNQEKALVGAFSVITTLRMELFQALLHIENIAWDWAPAEHRVTRVEPTLLCQRQAEDAWNLLVAACPCFAVPVSGQQPSSVMVSTRTSPYICLHPLQGDTSGHSERQA